MKVLISAYACEPDKGSEPEAGYRTLLAAASQHEVWLLTRDNNVAPLHAALRSSPFRERIHIVGLDLGRTSRLIKRWGSPGLHTYYRRWQRAAGEAALDLHHEIQFDIAHHVTFASFWTSIGVGALSVPLVIGPIGGAVSTPLRLLPSLGMRGTLEELVRIVARALGARNGDVRMTLRAARVVLVQNAETAKRIGRTDDALVLPNALAVDPTGSSPAARRTNEIAFVGRLIPWKAPILAVRALRDLADSDVSLHIYGEGPQRRRLERAARRWGIADRMKFEGHMERFRLRERIAGSAVLIHPAVHEEAGFAVAEALAAGTPVVCLDHGGPAELVRRWPHVPSRALAPQSPGRMSRSLAAAVVSLRDRKRSAGKTISPAVDFREAILGAYLRAVADPRPGSAQGS